MLNSSPLTRRGVLRGAATLGAATTAGLVARPATAGATARPAGLPVFRYVRDALALPLHYNRTGEFIFPCIRGVYDKLGNPRSRYYLYYAPHENPGGICVAFSDTLEGPFHDYSGNPIIDRQLPTTTVSHVSSPHVTWDASRYPAPPRPPTPGSSSIPFRAAATSTSWSSWA
ncbi:hypothetical protein [Nonomuraea jabiensis]|uniref:hypothetical protein n=1 Tax=Nonomuraea jabiensis TaxID=882448 RepID=UPI003D73F9D9